MGSPRLRNLHLKRQRPVLTSFGGKGHVCWPVSCRFVLPDEGYMEINKTLSLYLRIGVFYNGELAFIEQTMKWVLFDGSSLYDCTFWEYSQPWVVSDVVRNSIKNSVNHRIIIRVWWIYTITKIRCDSKNRNRIYNVTHLINESYIGWDVITGFFLVRAYTVWIFLNISNTCWIHFNRYKVMSRILKIELVIFQCNDFLFREIVHVGGSSKYSTTMLMTHCA